MKAGELLPCFFVAQTCARSFPAIPSATAFSVTSIPYRPLRSCSSDIVTVRARRTALYRWSGTQPPLIFLHGWGDSGLTFQFVIDSLQTDRACIALDWRGFGRSEWAAEGYWFPDYLADLDALLQQLSPNTPVDIVAHSMGGNVAMLYAGVRPERVRRLINLEGFGLASTQPTDAPTRYRTWLDQVRTGSPSFAEHPSFERFEWFLSKRNPRTPRDRIAFIARAWGEVNAAGAVALRADPRHRWVNPILYRRAEAEACWREITAQVVLVHGDHEWPRSAEAELEFHALCGLLRSVRVEVLRDAGHMLHHEHPEKIARLIDQFLT